MNRILLLFLLLGPAPAYAGSYRTETLTIRGKPQSLAIYEPDSQEKKSPVQVLVVSGDLGWIGLSTSIAEYLRSQGFNVVGFNVRAYLGAFTSKSNRLEESEVAQDIHTLVDWATSRQSLPQKVVLVGVSEGAGLSIIAMGQLPHSPQCLGIITLGLPQRTSLGWKWTDFTMWIRKKDPNEPMVETAQYLPHVRVPIAMIHSLHDEWDSVETARAAYQLIPTEKRLTEIDAVNHRFSNKIPQVLNETRIALDWLRRST